MTHWIARRFPGTTDWLRSRRDRTRWIIVFLLFFPFCVLETVFGHAEHSSSLIADAIHTATDSASILVMLVLAFTREWYKRVAFMEKWVERIVVWLLAVCIIPVLWGSVARFWHPELANGYTVMVIASFGAGANLLQHWVRDTAPHHCRDHSHDASMSHIVIDLWMNVLVVFGGLATALLQWRWIDPAVSLILIPVIVRELVKLHRMKKQSSR